MLHVKGLAVLKLFPGILGDLPPLITSAAVLTGQGHAVTIVGAGAKQETASFLESRNARLRLLGLSRYPGNSVDKAILRLRMAFLTFRTIRETKPDVIWFHGAFACTYRLIASIASRGSAIVVVHAHELHDEQKRLWRTQASAIARAQVLICPELTRGWILKVSTRTKAALFLAPNRPLADDAPIEPSDVQGIFRSNGGSAACSRFFIYQGLLSKERCITRLVAAFTAIENETVGLILMGPVPSEAFLKDIRSAIANDPRIVLLPPLVAPRHLHVAAGCDWGVVLYEPTSLNTVFCAPNKVYEYASCGLGMILPSFPGMTSLVDRHGLGELADPEDAKSISLAMRKLMQRTTDENRVRCERFLESENTANESYGIVIAHLQNLQEQKQCGRQS